MYKTFSISICLLVIWLSGSACLIAEAQGDMRAEQEKQSRELKRMGEEIGDLRRTMSEAADAMQQVEASLAPRQVHVAQFQLVVAESDWEILPGTKIKVLAYNGKVPGPVIRVRQGEQVRIVLTNKLSFPTSLYFHGLILPHQIDGLPRKGSGLVGPGQQYTYEFIASQAGTFWYHPQILHGGQQMQGLYGALIVEPYDRAPSYERDLVLVLGQFHVPELPASTPATKRKESPLPLVKVISPAEAGKQAFATYYTLNGKSAPAIPAIVLERGQRLRLRVINAGEYFCPLHVSGHRFEVVAVNGGNIAEPDFVRDTITLAPGDRIDLDLAADNPGIWSLGSILPAQISTKGSFPGGIACVVKYTNDL